MASDSVMLGESKLDEIVEWIVSLQCAQLESFGPDPGDSKLHALVSYGYSTDEAVTELAKDATTATLANSAGDTALHYSVKQLYFHGISVLGELPEQTSAQNAVGLSPLHMATLLQQYAKEICELLLDQGAQVLLKDVYGLTPLHYAAAVGSPELVCLCISRLPELPADFAVTIFECFNLAISAGNYAILAQLSVACLDRRAWACEGVKALAGVPAPPPPSVQAALVALQLTLALVDRAQDWQSLCTEQELKLKEELSTRCSEIDQLRAHNNDQLHEFKAANAQITALQIHITQIQAQNQLQAGQLQAAQTKYEKLVLEYNTLGRSAAQLQAEQTASLQLSKTFATQNRALQADLIKLKSECKSYQSNSAKLESQSFDTKGRLHEIANDIWLELEECDDKLCSTFRQDTGTSAVRVPPSEYDAAHSTSEEPKSLTHETDGEDDADSFRSAEAYDDGASFTSKPVDSEEHAEWAQFEYSEKIIAAQAALASSDLPSPWSAGYTEDGQFYIHNGESNESFWEMPDELREVLATLEANTVNHATPTNKTMDVWAAFFERLASRNGFAEDMQRPVPGGAAAGGQALNAHSDLMLEAMEMFMNAVHADSVGEAFDLWADHGLPAPHLCMDGDAASCISSLHVAAWNNSSAMLEMLLTCDPTVDADCKDAMGNTPLHIAAMAGHSEALQVLLPHCQHLFSDNGDGESALSLASQTHDPEHLGVLCSALKLYKMQAGTQTGAKHCASCLRDTLSQAAVFGSFAAPNSADIFDAGCVERCIWLLEDLAESDVPEAPASGHSQPVPQSVFGSDDAKGSDKESPISSPLQVQTEPTKLPPIAVEPAENSEFSIWGSLKQAFQASQQGDAPPCEEWLQDEGQPHESAPPMHFASGVGVQSPGLSVFKKNRGSVYKRGEGSAFNTPGTLSRRMSQEDSPYLAASKLSWGSSAASSAAVLDSPASSTPPLPPGAEGADAPAQRVAFLQTMPLSQMLEQPSADKMTTAVSVTGRYVDTFA